MLTSLMTTLTVVAFLAVVGNRLVEALVTPLFDHFKWDKKWILYISWVLTGALVFLSEANLFENIIKNAFIGQILTSVVAGGGANFLHDIFDNAPKPPEQGE